MQILLIESNPADAYLTQDALKQAGFAGSVTLFDDSEKALAHVRGASQRVDLIFLDLHVTPIPGLDLLQEIRRDPRVACTPVVIISGSENHNDVRRAYTEGANCYINKPTKLEEYLRFIRTCYEFWGTVVTLPRSEA